MLTALIVVFVVAYAAIALEHPLKVSKSASALVAAGSLWTIYILLANPDEVVQQLGESVAITARVVFFLMGAMTIVEVIDSHNGFDVITKRIRTSKLSSLMWIVCFVTFFLSAILDNLTTTIVMVSLMRKLLAKHEDRLLFAGMIVIAANSGGAWSPMGDVTTTMLWIGGQITSSAIIKAVILPAAVSLIVPLSIAAFAVRGRDAISTDMADTGDGARTTEFERYLMFFLGLGILVMVPVAKVVMHLPPFMGILFGLGILWLVGDVVHRDKEDESRELLTLGHALSKIDMSSIVFFIGILLSVAVLEHTHILTSLAHWLDDTVGRQDIIVLIIGIASAIVDNVPLVAAAMGMYSLTDYPTDHFFWEFLAYCAGTGGSLLIIGSAAGVAAMGIEKIDFIWYVRKISWLAALGYFAGAGVYLSQVALIR
jgi:Na+/H+ antiporter NhaD/arsenite permease-like protein